MNYPCDVNQPFMLNSLVFAGLSYLFQGNFNAFHLINFIFKIQAVFHIFYLQYHTSDISLSHSQKSATLHFVHKDQTKAYQRLNASYLKEPVFQTDPISR